MSEEAKNTYGGGLSDQSTVLIDEDLVQLDSVPEGCRLFKIPATRFAEKLGRKIVANIVMLGFITSITEVVGYEAMKQALFDSIPRGTEELNLKAFEKGYEYGKQLRQTDRRQHKICLDFWLLILF